jgi:hypothetical protein
VIDDLLIYVRAVHFAATLKTTVYVSLLAAFANIEHMTFNQGGDVAVPY